MYFLHIQYIVYQFNLCAKINGTENVLFYHVHYFFKLPEYNLKKYFKKNIEII